MNTYIVEHNGIKLEQIPLDKLTAQLQMQGLTVSLPHEILMSKEEINEIIMVITAGKVLAYAQGLDVWLIFNEQINKLKSKL